MADRKKTPDLLGSALDEPSAPQEELPITIQPAPANGTASASRSAKAKGGKKTKANAAAPASPPPASAPPVWEYLTVTFRDYGGWRPRLVNGEELSGWKHQPLIHDYLAQLGVQGWEMVGMGERHRNQKEAYFKRLVSDEIAGG